MPDGRGGYGAEARSHIICACETHWPQNSGDCSGFVKAVARALHLHPLLTGQANDIYDQIHGPYWNSLGTGTTGALLAGTAGAEGKFVVAAWKNKAVNEHGHVAIVVDFSNEQNRAMAYWGTLGSVGMRYARVTYSFSPDKLQATFFACRDLPHHVRHHRRVIGPLA